MVKNNKDRVKDRVSKTISKVKVSKTISKTINKVSSKAKVNKVSSKAKDNNKAKAKVSKVSKVINKAKASKASKAKVVDLVMEKYPDIKEIEFLMRLFLLDKVKAKVSKDSSKASKVKASKDKVSKDKVKAKVNNKVKVKENMTRTIHTSLLGKQTQMTSIGVSNKIKSLLKMVTISLGRWVETLMTKEETQMLNGRTK